MIRLSVGNVGSGKTATEVREMILSPNKRATFTNILIKGGIAVPHVKLLQKEMILEETEDGKFKLNIEFWKQLKEPINIVIDEAHTIFNSRRAMSKKNIIISEWIALIRRVLGASESGVGDLVLITQMPYRIDNIARDMANQVRYHICHFRKICPNCKYNWIETSETAEPVHQCPMCNHPKVIKCNHTIEVWHFTTVQSYMEWKLLGKQTFHRHYMVNDIEAYFPYYDTLQWDNLFN